MLSTAPTADLLINDKANFTSSDPVTPRSSHSTHLKTSNTTAIDEPDSNSKEAGSTNANQIDTATGTLDASDSDFALAHQLAHALRSQDTDRFIFIYDNIIPDHFDQTQVSYIPLLDRKLY
jgi:hypothetical protein